MKIVIVGAGQVGATLAENLARENNDITIVDIDANVLRALQDRLDVRTVVGTGCYPDVLVNAGIEDADMIVAVTRSDEINIVACQVAYSLFHTPTKIARVRSRNYSNPEYKNKLFNDKHMPIDVMITPEQVVTNYIQKLIEQPGALQVLDFADGVIQLVGLRAVEDGPLVGQRLRALKEHMPDIDARVAAIYRKDGAIFPTGDTIIEDGDEVFFIAAKKNIRKVMSELRRLEKPYRQLVIAGGGNIGFRLSKALENDYNIKIIEFSDTRAELLSEQLNKTVVLRGSATDQELLLDENIDKTDVFIALTNDDEVNIMSSLMAKRLGVRQVITLITKPAYVDLVQGGEIDVAISPQQATTSSVLSHVRKADVARVHSLRRGAAEAMEAIAHGDASSSNVVGRKIQELKLPSGVTIGAVVRGEEVLIAHDDVIIATDDHVILFMVDKSKVTAVERLFQVSLNFV